MVFLVAGHLFELPTELVLEIASYLHPSQLVNIALTCSHLHRQVKAELRQHQKYHFASDLSPRVILKLLQPDSRCGAINSYVRHMEIWGSRKSWEDWSTWKVLQSGELQTVSESELEPRVGPKLFIKYLDLAQELWHIPEEDAIIAQEELENGGDGFIKMLLFASYHHLQSLKFVKGEKYHTSLQWLTTAVGWSRLSGRWPPGFQSLRHVAVGVVDGHDLDKERVAGEAVDIAAILNLPNMKGFISTTSLSMKKDARSWNLIRSCCKITIFPRLLLQCNTFILILRGNSQRTFAKHFSMARRSLRQSPSEAAITTKQGDPNSTILT